MIKKGGQVMFSRRIAGCCRRVLVVVLVSVLLVSACSSASEEVSEGLEEGGEGSEQRALDVLGEVFAEEKLDTLQVVFTEEELVDLEGQFSGEELVELLGSELEGLSGVSGPVGAEGSAGVRDYLDLFRSSVEGFPDDDLLVWAFTSRVSLDGNLFGLDANDISTPVGAFCWVVLRLRWVMPSPDEVYDDPYMVLLDLDSWHSNSLKLWLIEREAADRGLELGWETGPTGYNNSLRRFLLQATGAEVRDVVFSEGLPQVLRPVAESFYDYFDGLLELAAYRVRPLVEEVSGYSDLAGMTGEEIRRVWPEILGMQLDRDDYDEYVNLFKRLEEDEVRGLLNSECKQRTSREILERACPDWVVETSEYWNLLLCGSVPEGLPQYIGSNSDCLFGCAPGAGRGSSALFARERPFGSRPFEGFMSMSVGLDYACGIRSSGVVWCWNWWYLPDGEKGMDSSYSASSKHAFKLVDAGWDFACGLRPDGGELHCWWTRTPLGELESPAGEFKEVSVGIEHACAIRAGGELECWGIDLENAKVSPPAGEFLSVDAGWDGDVHLSEGDTLNDGGFSCGLRADAVVECWGEQKLVYGEGSARGEEFAGVAVGRDGRICVLRTDGVIHCGEDRVYGSTHPQGDGFVQVSVGGLNHVCGLRANKSVECWDADGEFLGSIPEPFTEIEVGYTYEDIPLACGLLEDKRILCWDLKEEVFKWAAGGLEEYTRPQCFLDFPEPKCWTAGIDPPREVDDAYTKESPILLPHSNSVLYP